MKIVDGGGADRSVDALAVDLGEVIEVLVDDRGEARVGVDGDESSAGRAGGGALLTT